MGEAKSNDSHPKQQQQEASLAITDNTDGEEVEVAAIEPLGALTDNSDHEDEDELDYHSHASEEDNDADDPSFDISLSSMSEEGGERLRHSLNNSINGDSHSSLDLNIHNNDLNLQSSRSNEKQDSNHNSNGSEPNFSYSPDRKPHHLQSFRSTSTGSSHDRNNSGTNSTVLECVAADPGKPPSSPLGSVSVASGGSPTAAHKHLPRFYDSEARREVLAEIESLVDMTAENNPEDSKYLLEIDFN